MANETERVEYIFEGDVKSLRTATQAAMGLLNKYSDTMKRASSTEGFKASKKSTQSMNAAISKLTKDVDKMQAKLKSVGDVKLPSGGSASKAMSSMLSELNSQMVKLGSSSPVTTKTLNEFKTQLDGIRMSLQSASTQVERLIASEQRHQNAIEAVRGTATRLRESMDSMKSKLSGAFDPVTSKLKTLSSVFNPITSRIQSFKDVAGTALSRVGQLASTLASAFRRVSQEEANADAAARRSTESHRSLGNLFGNVSSKIKAETSAIQEEKKELSSKETTLKKSEGSHRSLLQTITELGRRVSAEAKSFSLLKGTLNGFNPVVNALKSSLGALTGIQLSDWLGKATSSAIDYIENLNLFTVAMGSSVEKGLEFVATMQEVYGMDPSNLYRYAGYFYQLSDAIGATSTASATMSLSLTKAANDIASLFNVEIEQVVNNLASGMQGMTRAVRKYGMDIRMVTLQQTALKYGFTEQVETTSEANRMVLRYITMMEQASNAIHQYNLESENSSEAMGDFARNIETPANQLRIFKEQMSQLGRAIGNFIVVPLSKAIAYVNGFIMALRMVLNFIASSLRLLNTSIKKVDTSGADEAADAVNGIGTAAGSAAEKLKDLTAPFDELNVLQEQAASGGGSGGGISDDILDPALEKALEDMELKLEDIQMKANKVRDSILKFLGFTVGKVNGVEIISWNPDILEKNLINKFPQWTKTIEATFSHWSEIVDGFKAVFRSLGGVVDTMVEKILNFFGTFINDDSVSQFISNLGDNLQNFSDWITEHENGIANFALILIGLVGAFKLFSGVATTLGPVVTTISKIIKVLAPLGSSFSSLIGSINPIVIAIAAVVGIFALAYTQFESVRNAVDDLKDGFNQMVDNVSEAFKALWVDILKPVVDNIVSVFKELWSEHLSKLVEEVGLSVAAIIDFIMSVVGVISELITFLSAVFGPIVSTVINFVVDLFGTFIGVVSDVITRILAVLRGLITFITGVFQGDWSKAWSGIVAVFKNVFGLFVDILKGIVNVGIDLLNGLVSAVWNAVRGIINGVGSIAQQIGELLGKKDWGWKLTAQPPKIPHLKTGGVVTSPTYALIGEGRYNEAVIPLDNSPQMEQLVQRIADAVDRDDKSGNGSGSSPVEVRVYIGGKEYDAFTYKAAKRGERIVGAQPIMERG